MTDTPPAAAPAPAPARKPVDWDNVVAFVVAAALSAGVMYFKPEGAALGEASAVIGGCLLYIQRKPS